MPRNVPAKVIKVGFGAQSRIAQACDRCRSKKIRCDGVRPICTHCQAVGFECTTSDRLSRRAFPRGYTESLEEKVRNLESNIRDLKATSSRDPIVANTDPESTDPSSSHPPSLSLSLPIENPDEEDARKTENTDETSEVRFRKTSLQDMMDSIQRHPYDLNYPGVDHDVNVFLSKTLGEHSSSSTGSGRYLMPTRNSFEYMCKNFFDNWGPIFPVLNRDTFVEAYDSYEKCLGSTETPIDYGFQLLVQLIAGILSLARKTHDFENRASLEADFENFTETLISDRSISSLQILILGLFYFLQSGNKAKLLQCKGLAIATSEWLRLHTSQEKSGFDYPTSELRRRVFWTLYSLDCCSASYLGLPMQLKDFDISCEYPINVDGQQAPVRFHTTPPPIKYTSEPNAIDFFRLTHIMAGVLAEYYSVSASGPSFSTKLASLAQKLETWASGTTVPYPRKLSSSTTTLSTHSLNLRLMYHYVRLLIHRPAVLAGAAEQLPLFVESCEEIVKIVCVFDQRHIWTFAYMNREETLMTAGLGVVLDFLSQNQSALHAETHQFLESLLQMLTVTENANVLDFRNLCHSILATGSLAWDETQPYSTSSSDQVKSARMFRYGLHEGPSSSGNSNAAELGFWRSNIISPESTTFSAQAQEPASSQQNLVKSMGDTSSVRSEPIYSPAHWSEPMSADSHLSRRFSAQPLVVQSPYLATPDFTYRAASSSDLVPARRLGPRPAAEFMFEGVADASTGGGSGGVAGGASGSGGGVTVGSAGAAPSPLLPAAVGSQSNITSGPNYLVPIHVPGLGLALPPHQFISPAATMATFPTIHAEANPSLNHLSRYVTSPAGGIGTSPSASSSAVTAAAAAAAAAAAYGLPGLGLSSTVSPPEDASQRLDGAFSPGTKPSGL